MFQRDNKELSFENLRLENSLLKTTQENLSSSSSQSSLSSTCSSTASSSSCNINNEAQEEITFLSMMKTYNENFIIISQREKAAFLNLTLSDIIRFFSMPSCTKQDGKMGCNGDCDCFRSLEIGMQIYDKGGVQSFNQFGNYLIGYLIEQQTDPMTRIAIEMDTSMRQIKKIYCPCKFHFCPHAFALLYFRIKLPTFYAIKLPPKMLSENITQKEVIKFYGYLMEESRSLPIMCDYQTKQWTQDQLKSYIDTSGSNGYSQIYGYCHKSLLPIASNIVEEQTRARKWISELHSKRSFSYSTMVPMTEFGRANQYENFCKQHQHKSNNSCKNSNFTNQFKQFQNMKKN